MQMASIVLKAFVALLLGKGQKAPLQNLDTLPCKWDFFMPWKMQFFCHNGSNFKKIAPFGIIQKIGYIQNSNVVIVINQVKIVFED